MTELEKIKEFIRENVVIEYWEENGDEGAEYRYSESCVGLRFKDESEHFTTDRVFSSFDA